MNDIVLSMLSESIEVKETFVRSHLDTIMQGATTLARCLASGHKILIFGNGGSAADSQHIAAEFVNRFRIERSPLAAMALTTDTSIITSIGNDYSFDEIFSKQVRALGKPHDVAWGISTSGNSKNVVKAIREAGRMGLHTMAMTGSGGELAALADLVFAVPSDSTPRIQETHGLLGHILCDLVDRILYPEKY